MAFPASQTIIEENHQHQQQSSSFYSEKSCGGDIENHNAGTRLGFLALRHVCSTSPCVGSSNIVSKKVKARKLTLIDSDFNDDRLQEEEMRGKSEPKSRQVRWVYSRRQRKKSLESSFDSFVEKFEVGEPKGISEAAVKSELVDGEGFIGDVLGFSNKKRLLGSSELVKLGVDSSLLCTPNGPRLRRCQDNGNCSKARIVKRKARNSFVDHWSPDECRVKKWLQVALDGVDPVAFVGLKCKVYWPLDNAWYKAAVAGYVSKSNCHSVKYDDGDEEELILLHEQIKFHISEEEMQKLNIRGIKCNDDEDPDYSQLVGLAATVDESQELEPGDIIWAKLTGHAMWPAVIVNAALVRNWKGLNKSAGGISVPVQFFGSHDFARIQVKQTVSFMKGLISCFHLRCKSPQFLHSLKEARKYLNEQRLPESMLSMQRVCEDVQAIDSIETSKMDANVLWPTRHRPLHLLGNSQGQSVSHKSLERRMPLDVTFLDFEDLSNSEGISKFCADKMLLKRYDEIPCGYRPVHIDWKDLDRCNVCHMDEEYENNLFLQCDKCRMMVHARCYGEQSVDGVLWLCNLCRVGAPVLAPPCRLCPVVGGAMKPTTDGHWAHLACAIWIPETCLSNIKRMEPIDGLSSINKDRWKLLCSICGVPYGACIQCSNNTCRVAYHPLCARAAGLCVELEDEDKLHLTSLEEEDEDEQCIRLLSFCKRHKQPSHHHPIADESIEKKTYSSYSPPPNISGCARCEPYDYSSRRGRKEPEVVAAASVKRLFLQNMPYLVGGYCLQYSLTRISEVDNIVVGSKISSGIQNRTSNHGSSISILSMADKYKHMRETFRKRLAFGKSRIHGFGIFAKQPHKAGDLVIEYTGELVRPLVADCREHFIYNSLVGAGTYMFRIDDERVIDATRAGSIAHLINHSCEPNCYSRVITVSGDEHIIIFAKRDIKQWEELTYDYRFFSMDEQLKCYCGSQRCRGVVNDTEAEEQAARLYVPCSELIDCKGE